MYDVGGLPTDTFASGDTAPTGVGEAAAVPRNSTATTDNRRSVMASPSRSDCGHHTPAHQPAQDVDARLAAALGLTDFDRRNVVGPQSHSDIPGPLTSAAAAGRAAARA